MNALKKVISLLIIILLSSCRKETHFTQTDNFKDFKTLNLNKIIDIEKKNGSLDITPYHLIGIGEGIYPNKLNFNLATPKTYKWQETSNFEVETEYFYTAKDSSVKVILYSWELSSEKNSMFYAKEKLTKNKIFQNKFNSIKNVLCEELGEPSEVNIEQYTTKEDAFRDDVNWLSESGINAYLFMFGNIHGFREIRLAIYQD
ncbi:hypothetical protein [Hymenobacter sp. HDW8]|uniref:hypothetical protein n=1 Tax=Hymenobacter sp. HDW8 TaxID=2714932 RepID=UPI00140A90DA|nr:hypothetical protein [Hymenobacter sp. HDW8]QIL74785.1 hypothetical protein G7064_02095 [Hymenobacter sp. HDW8]